VIYADKPGTGKFSASYCQPWDAESCDVKTFVLNLNIVKEK
jgi:hypothetical protein